MAKYFGAIGFAETKEIRSGVWDEHIVEHFYSGDEMRNSRRLQSADQVNDSINIANEISIVADPYANQNFHAMRYATFMGTRWKVSNVRVEYPRLILTLGDIFNG